MLAWILGGWKEPAGVIRLLRTVGKGAHQGVSRRAGPTNRRGLGLGPDRADRIRVFGFEVGGTPRTSSSSSSSTRRATSPGPPVSWSIFSIPRSTIVASSRSRWNGSPALAFRRRRCSTRSRRRASSRSRWRTCRRHRSVTGVLSAQDSFGSGEQGKRRAGNPLWPATMASCPNLRPRRTASLRGMPSRRAELQVATSGSRPTPSPGITTSSERRNRSSSLTPVVFFAGQFDRCRVPGRYERPAVHSVALEEAFQAFGFFEPDQ